MRSTLIILLCATVLLGGCGKYAKEKDLGFTTNRLFQLEKEVAELRKSNTKSLSGIYNRLDNISTQIEINSHFRLGDIYCTLDNGFVVTGVLDSINDTSAWLSTSDNKYGAYSNIVTTPDKIVKNCEGRTRKDWKEFMER